MKIVFTGGGTGGHFYPLIAIAESITDLARERYLIPPALYYVAPTPFDTTALFENGITFIPVPAGKLRRYRSLRNLIDAAITAWGVLVALYQLYRIYPDVVMSKGGYGSLPTVIAAWVLRIPIVIHESDAKPGRSNLIASRFAASIAISFDSAAAFFPAKVQPIVARTGIPIRKSLTRIEREGAYEFLKLERGIPTIVILGGSQGAQRINDVILSSIVELVKTCNVIHQTGRNNYGSVTQLAQVILERNPHASRYHPIDYLTETVLQRAAGAATVIVSRAGAGQIAEISMWNIPSILIPIPESISHDQRSNAYAYARTGAASVLEEGNLTPHVLVSEIERIVSNRDRQAAMAAAAASFTDPDAARILANEVLSIALSHEL